MADVLKNPRHEKFARGVAAGVPIGPAYIEAGYPVSRKTAQSKASVLAKRPEVAARIVELDARAAIGGVAAAIKRGQPTQYRPGLAELAYKMALLGATSDQAADAMHVTTTTYDEWQRKHKPFREAIKRGKVEADANIADSLYHRALGYSHPAVKIFMPAGATEPVYAPYTQYYPPDTSAASLWLRNRHRDLWAERREVAVEGTLEHRLRQMTPEERAKDAAELVGRMRAVLAADRARTIEGEATEVADEEEGGEE